MFEIRLKEEYHLRLSCNMDLYIRFKGGTVTEVEDFIVWELKERMNSIMILAHSTDTYG
jgi:hypothetical protein